MDKASHLLVGPVTGVVTPAPTHMNTVTPLVVVRVQLKMVETQTSTILATAVTAIFL